MVAYHPDDINKQTVLAKNGDASFKPIVCVTLSEAVIEVKNRWREADQARARFKITGGREYTWADIKPHI